MSLPLAPSAHRPIVHRRAASVQTDDTSLCGVPNSDTVNDPGLVSCTACRDLTQKRMAAAEAMVGSRVAMVDNLGRTRVAHITSAVPTPTGIAFTAQQLAVGNAVEPPHPCTCDADGGWCEYHFDRDA